MLLKRTVLPFSRVFFLLALLPVTLVWALSGTTETGFSTFYGGSQEECLFDRCAITQDSDGNLIISGTTRSPDFPTVNAFMEDEPDGTGEDIFLMKLTPDGQTVLFSTYLGNGAARAVAVDSNDNILIAGYTSDREFFTTPDAVQDCDITGVKAVALKMSGDGQELLYSTCLRGNSQTRANSIEADSDDHIIVAGFTQATDFPTLNPAQATNSGQEDAFVSKIDGQNGNLIFSTYFGGEGRDYAWGVSTDAAGNVYAGGATNDPDTFPQTPGVVGPDSPRGTAMVFKLSPAGQLVYSSVLGLVTHEAAMVKADADGYLYFLWNNFNGVGKLNQDASAFVYRAQVDDLVIGEGQNFGGLDVDEDGNAYVTAAISRPGGDRDIAVAVIHHTGRPVYFDTLGGANREHGFGVTVRRQDDGRIDAAYVGFTQSTNFPVLNPLQDELRGPADMVIHTITGLEAVVDVTFLQLPVIIR
jgi:hypothetical protein